MAAPQMDPDAEMMKKVMKKNPTPLGAGYFLASHHPQLDTALRKALLIRSHLIYGLKSKVNYQRHIQQCTHLASGGHSWQEI